MVSKQLKKTVLLGMSFVVSLLALALAGGILSCAAIAWATGDWADFVYTLSALGIGWIIAAAGYGAFVLTDATMAAAMAGFAAALGPIGWAIFGAIVIAA